MVELRENETRILAALDKLGGKAAVEQLMLELELPDAAVMRAALTLQEKSLVKMHAKPETRVKVTEEGASYAQNGIPERRLVNAVIAADGEASMSQAAKDADLDPQFAQIALGWTQRKKWATFDSKNGTLQAKSAPKEGSDERLLSYLCGREQATLDELSPDLQTAVGLLKRRKLVSVEEKTARVLELTRAGAQAVDAEAAGLIMGHKEVTQLTPELIITGKWRDVKLRKYNIEAPVAKAWPGKKHPYLSFLDEVRAKLIMLGFKEMTGTVVETSFFNFDALYTPQDHPAREPDGIYMVKDPEFGDINAYVDAVERVKAVHENGGSTGSTGWGYKYSVQEAKRLILRGHGTCLSARTLLSKDLKIPSKYFSVARVYRPEVVDKTHLSEFNQVEGIV
ncbi:MAG: phenylalanine--tRNA ligase subunit alpha, partial [Candidatus Bathyarchaeia archaeon]